jgi:hypothetical protein
MFLQEECEFEVVISFRVRTSDVAPLDVATVVRQFSTLVDDLL